MANPIIVSNIKNYINDFNTLDKLHLRIFELLENKDYKYMLALPASFIHRFSSELWNNIIVGGQNFDINVLNVPETGINTLNQIVDSGAKFILLGHSEVRDMGEDDEYINQKVLLALKNNTKIILCVGEKNRNKNKDNIDYIDFIKNQLNKNLRGVLPISSKNIIIAYEPIWAIGTDNPANIDQILEMNIIIRRTMNEMFGIDNAKNIKILYGGSVNSENAKDFITDAGSDGLLIGHSSVTARDFAKIINKCNE